MLSYCLTSTPAVVAALSGSCPRVNLTKTVKSVKYVCKRANKQLRWAVQSPARPVSTIPARPVEVLVHRTLSNQTRNTTFQIALQEFPEIAQGVTFEAAATFNVLQLSLYGLNTVKPEFFRVPFNQKSQYEEAVTTFEPFEATVTVSIWRATGFPDSIDLGTGFSLVHTERVATTMASNTQVASAATMNVDLTLGKKIDVTAGSYLIVLGFEWKNLGVLTVRFWGQESGTNTAGGKGGDLTKNCSYVPTADAYPAGRAYAGLGIRSWNGQADSSIGFGTRFAPATAKVTACIVRGEWGNDIFNPGDLDLALLLRS